MYITKDQGFTTTIAKLSGGGGEERTIVILHPFSHLQGIL